MKKTFTLTGEYFIAVSDSLEIKDFNSPFKVQQAMQTIERMGTPEISAHIKESLIRTEYHELAENLIISDCKFLEFDSTNPFHATGYFEFTVTGPENLREKTEIVFGDLLTNF